MQCSAEQVLAQACQNMCYSSWGNVVSSCECQLRGNCHNYIIHNKRGRKYLTAKTEMENIMFYACCKKCLSLVTFT